MTALVKQDAQSDLAVRLAHNLAEVEKKLHPLVTKMLDEGMGLTSSRDTSRVVLSTLSYAKYLRDAADVAEKIGDTDHDGELKEDDLVALPQADLEKIVKLSTRLLGKERVRELTA